MEDLAGIFVGGLAVFLIFLGLPWLIFHYVTKWKTAGRLSDSDEKLLDELHDMARRLDDRMCSIERIMNAENPGWRQQCLPDDSIDSIRAQLDLSRTMQETRR